MLKFEIDLHTKCFRKVCFYVMLKYVLKGECYWESRQTEAKYCSASKKQEIMHEDYYKKGIDLLQSLIRYSLYLMFELQKQ